MNKHYSQEEKKQIVYGHNGDISLADYIKQFGICLTTFYKWKKIFKDSNNISESNTYSLIEMNDLLNCDISDKLELSIKEISIYVKPNYNEPLLLSLINTLKKL